MNCVSERDGYFFAWQVLPKCAPAVIHEWLTTKCEAPCEDPVGSDRGCNWVDCCEICNDTYCTQCLRFRDWSLELYPHVNDFLDIARAAQDEADL